MLGLNVRVNGGRDLGTVSLIANYTLMRGSRCAFGVKQFVEQAKSLYLYESGSEDYC